MNYKTDTGTRGRGDAGKQHPLPSGGEDRGEGATSKVGKYSALRTSRFALKRWCS